MLARRELEEVIRSEQDVWAADTVSGGRYIGTAGENRAATTGNMQEVHMTLCNGNHKTSM